MRWAGMSDSIETLWEEMRTAADAGDFERAAVLRDRINLLRGGAKADTLGDIDTSGIARQRPGAMGLGSSRQSVRTPDGWKPPKKPDPMTRGRSRRKGD